MTWVGGSPPAKNPAFVGGFFVSVGCMFDILHDRQNPFKKQSASRYSYGKDDRVFVLGGWDIKRSPAPSISPPFLFPGRSSLVFWHLLEKKWTRSCLIILACATFHNSRGPYHFLQKKHMNLCGSFPHYNSRGCMIFCHPISFVPSGNKELWTMPWSKTLFAHSSWLPLRSSAS